MFLRQWMLGLACLVSTGAGWCLVCQDPEIPTAGNRAFMQAKLDHSKGIVEGLALENYERIAISAQNLMLLSQESAWNVVQAPEYISLSAEFRNSAERLRDAATAQNIDGATIAWFEVTMSCVRCHRFLRQKKQAPAPGAVPVPQTEPIR